ncbi:hypothetical protein C8J57DRAFT_1500303 [Mycena rebaudengoi]|nr:hypothetical protein C8J57DRAFT_1500303 [Mycena rebaudengoi]
MARKLSRTKSPRATTTTVELDPTMPAIRVVRKPRKTIKRRFTLMWKRLSTPSRPRASRRFSFIPPDFDLVSRETRLKSTRDERRKSKYLEAVHAEQ